MDSSVLANHRKFSGRLRSRLRSIRISRLFHRIEQGKEVGIRRVADCRLSIYCLYKFGEFHPPERMTSKLFLAEFTHFKRAVEVVQTTAVIK